MSISDNIRNRMTSGSWIRKMFEESRALIKEIGEENVFDLTLGNPILEPPSEFNSVLQKIVNNPYPGMHRYMENAGYADTREAVALYLKTETGINFSRHDIIMTVGAAGALNIVLKSICNPGDEIIIFSPFFFEYNNYIDNHSGIVKVVPSDTTFVPQLDLLEKAINKRTKGVIINSPNNPTGIVYSYDVLRAICEILERCKRKLGTDIYLISDETYRRLVYDEVQVPYIFNLYTQSIVTTSSSKDLGLSGERIGYVAIHPDMKNHNDMVNACIFCNRILGFVNAPALMQNTIKHILNASVRVDEYKKKRDFIYSHLVDMGYSITKPHGTFYIFPKTPIEDDIAFVRELQSKYHVMTTPGVGFGVTGYFRISFSVEDKVLRGSLPGFKKAAQEYGLCK
jgi:aspartate aminotransferase